MAKTIQWILLLGLLGIAAYAISGGQLFAWVGGAVLSLSQVDYVSNDPTINGPAWLLTMSVDGSGQFAEGYFTDAAVKDPQTGEKTKYPLTVKVSLDKQQCAYALSLRPPEDKVHTLTLTEIPGQLWGNRDEICKATYPVLAPDFYASWTMKDARPIEGTFFCLFAPQVGLAGNLGTPALNFEASIETNANNVIQTGRINNRDAKSAWVGDKVHVSWAGSLSTGETCPRGADEGVGAAWIGGWRTVDFNKLNSYLTNKLILINDISAIGNTQTGETNFRFKVDQYNALSTDAQAYKPLTLSGGSTAPLTSVPNVMTGGQAFLELPKLISNPIFTFRIKADYLGIVVPVGMPQIVSLTTQKFISGSGGNIEAVIKNVGAGQGSFSVSASCQQPFAQVGSAITVSLAPSVQTTVWIPISGSTSSADLSADCAVNVVDINNPNNKATGTVRVTVSPPIVCTNIGATICMSGNVMVCSGSNWAPQQKCQFGCKDTSTGAVCTGEIQPVCGNNKCEIGETVENCAKDCKPKIIGGELPLGWLVLGGIAVAVIFLMRRRK